MSRGTFIDLCYLVAAIGFIVALKALGSPRRARAGNLIAAAGMALAIGVTFARPGLGHIGLIVGAMAVGVVIGVPAARLVKMTAMPQMVAAFNGVGGGAAAVVSITEFIGARHEDRRHLQGARGRLRRAGGQRVVLGLGARLRQAAGADDRPPDHLPRPAADQRRARAGAIVGLVVAILVTSSTPLLWVLLGLALVLGVIFVLPIGGADVPVLISLLNSFTGLAVAASGFTLDSNVLVVAGTLVGASGMLLTRMMSAAMGRSLPNILFSAFGSVVTATGESGGPDGPRRCARAPPRTWPSSSPTRARS